VVLAEDETHLNLRPWVRATWILKGSRQPVMTPGTNRRRTIFGAVDLQSGRWLYQVTRKAVSAAFTAFLDQVLSAYPTAPKIAVICDNVIIHHAKVVRRWLASHPGSWCCTARATARMTTRSSASEARSTPPWPTARP
jgi:DDE superfamily endonuclease